MGGNFKQISGPSENKPANRRNTPFSDLFFGGDPLRGLFAPVSTNASGGTEILRTDDGFLLEIPVPGFRREQVEVTVNDHSLAVEGNADQRNFTRSFLLPDEIDTENIEASVDNGLLLLKLHRRPDNEPRRIQIKSQPATPSLIPHDEQENVHAARSDTRRSIRFGYAQEGLHNHDEVDAVLASNI